MQSVVYVQKCRDRNVPRPKRPVPEMTDATTGGNDIGLRVLWLANIPEKFREY